MRAVCPEVVAQMIALAASSTANSTLTPAIASVTPGVDHRRRARPSAGLLGGPGNRIHHADGFHRVAPHGRLPTEHDRVGAVKDGVGHVADLGSRGLRLLGHGFEHLRGGDDRLAGRVGRGDEALLQERHLRRRQLDAEVAAGHHNAVGHRQDICEGLDRLMLFELGEDEGLPAGGRLGTDQRAEHGDVVAGLRTKLRAIASTPCATPQAASARSFAVSVGADRVAPGKLRPLKLRRMPPRTTSQVMRGSSAARTRTSIRPSSIRIVPPGRTSRASGAYCTGSASPAVAAGSTVSSSVSPGGDGTTGAGYRPQTHLGTLQVLEDGQRPVGLAGDPPQPLDHQGVGGMRAVGEVEPRHVHAGAEHRPQRGLILAGGPDGGDDTRAAGLVSRCRHEGLVALRFTHPAQRQRHGAPGGDSGQRNCRPIHDRADMDAFRSDLDDGDRART